MARHAPDLKKKQLEDLRRVIFFQNSYAFAARPIPGLDGLEQMSGGKSSAEGSWVPLVGGGDGTRAFASSDEGDYMAFTSVSIFCAPVEMKLRAAPQAAADTQPLSSSMKELTLDFRCSDCVHSFADENSLLMHCRDTGHFPAGGDDGSGGDVRPANKEEFIQYANVVLSRALGERYARWGRDYIDPKSWTDPEDKFGKSLGVRVFKAFSCEFGWNKSRPDPNEPLQLVLTVCDM